MKIVQEHLPLGISARDLDDEKLWEVLCHASVNQSYIESSCRVLDEAPSDNTVRAHLIEALGDDDQALEQLKEELNQALQAQLPQAVRRKLRSQAWEAAGDWVDIPYHGKDGKEDKNVRPNQPKAGSTRFHAYAKLAIIRKGERVTLAMTVARRCEKMDQIVKRLIAQARQLGARFKCTYWDKAFGAVEMIRYLRACHVPYVIALAQHGKNGLRRLCFGRCGRCARYTYNTKKKKGAYTTDVAIACHYAGRASKRRPKKKKKGVRYYAYAVYGVGTGLRLLLIGLALMLVNLYILLRASWTIVTRYGSRIRYRAVTLDEVAITLLAQIQLLLGFAPEFHCRARCPDS